MKIKKHTEFMCDICGNHINTKRFEFAARHRIKVYSTFNKHMCTYDICDSCFSRMAVYIKEHKNDKDVQDE